MRFEFERGVVQGGERGDGGELAGFEVKRGTGIDVAESEVADHVFEIGGNKRHRELGEHVGEPHPAWILARVSAPRVERSSVIGAP